MVLVGWGKVLKVDGVFFYAHLGCGHLTYNAKYVLRLQFSLQLIFLECFFFSFIECICQPQKFHLSA